MNITADDAGGRGVLVELEDVLCFLALDSGMDMLEPLMQMERFAHHTGARIFDEIGVNRWNQAYKGEAIYNAVKSMAQGVKVGDTVIAN